MNESELTFNCSRSKGLGFGTQVFPIMTYGALVGDNVLHINIYNLIVRAEVLLVLRE